MQFDWNWFTFPFEDEKVWNKLIIAAVVGLLSIFLVPVLIFYGIGLRVMKTTIETGEPELPDFADIGGLLGDGLKAVAVLLVYSLPLIVLIVGFTVLIIALTAGAAAVTGDSDAFGAGAALMINLATFGLVMLSVPLSLATQFFAGVATTRLAVSGKLADAFQLGEVWQLTKDGVKHFALAYLVYLAVGLAISFVSQILVFTIIFLCLLPFLIGPYYMYLFSVQGVLFGQAYRETKGAVPPAELDTGPPTPTDLLPADL